MKKYIHINQHIIRRNKSNGYNEPVITVKTYKSNDYGHEVTVNGPCKIVYSPDKPLSCGARVWIETEADVTVENKSPASYLKSCEKFFKSLKLQASSRKLDKQPESGYRRIKEKV